MRLRARFGGFFVLQLLGLLAPLVALPVVARVGGAEGFVSVSVAQAIGSIASVVVFYGWWTVGPAEFHRLTSDAERRALYIRSWAGRAIVSIFALPIAIALTAVLVPSAWLWIGIIVCVGATVSTLSPGWFFVAQGNPWGLAAYEAVPRFAAVIVAAPIMIATGDIVWYAVLTLLGSIVPSIVHLANIARGPGLRFPSLRDVTSDLRTQLPVALTNVLGSLYSMASVPAAAGLVATNVLAPYVSADRVYRASRFSITSLGNTFQGWVLEKPEERRRKAVAVHAVFGLVGGATFAALAPTVCHVLFGRVLAPSYLATSMLGVAFASTSILTPLVRVILIPARAYRIPLFGTLAAVLVGASSLVMLAREFGSDGVAVSVALSEVTNLLIAAVAVRVVSQKSGRRDVQ